MQSLLTFKVRRGKSELHRAGCWLTASQGDLKDSATEIYRCLLTQAVRVERRGKSSPRPMVTWEVCKLYPQQRRLGL